MGQNNLNGIKWFFCHLLLPLLSIWSLTSCDGPRDRRKVRVINDTDSVSNENRSSNSSGGSNSTDNYSPTGNTSGNSKTYDDDDEGNTQDNETTNVNLPAEFSHCKLDNNKYTHYHRLIGDFSICQSKGTSQPKVLIQTKEGISDYRLCVFPTSDENGQGSVMIGGPQCYFANAGVYETLTLSVNRSGFTNRRVTGVMIVKDMPYGEVTPYHRDMVMNPPTYTMAFEDCMVYLANTGDSYACMRFKVKGNYVYVAF